MFELIVGDFWYSWLLFPNESYFDDVDDDNDDDDDVDVVLSYNEEISNE